MAEQVLERIEAMISRTIGDRKRLLVQYGDETGRVALRRDVDAAIAPTGSHDDKGASGNISPAYVVKVTDDLVAGSLARMLAQFSETLMRLDLLLEANIHL